MAALAVCTYVAFGAVPARADWTLSGATSLRHDDNVGNAQDPADKVADFSAAANLSLFESIPIGEGSILSAGGSIGGEIYDHLTGLRNADLNGVLSLRKKWGLGAFAPWIRTMFSVGRAEYQDGYRDADIYGASVAAGKRVDARWNLWAQFAFEQRVANPESAEIAERSSDVFSVRGRALSANADYSITERTTLSAGALLRHGDIVSTASATSYLFTNARAVVDDPTFGAEAYAYRLLATTFGVRLALQYSLGAHNLIGCALQHSTTHARGGGDYGETTPEFNWNYQF